MSNIKGFQSLTILVILLALAGISCNAVNVPFLATETPTPTATFTPSPTPSPTLTPSPTPTLVPTATHPSTGIWTDEQPDGSSLVTDYDNQYRFVMAGGWTIIPLSAGDLSDILEELAGENPELTETAELFKELDPDVIRIVAVNNDPKYTTDGYGTNLTVAAIEDQFASSMPISLLTGGFEQSFAQSGAVNITSKSRTNNKGVEIGIVEYSQNTPTAAGVNVDVRARVIFFQVNGKLIMITLATHQQFSEEIFASLDGLAETIELME